MAPDGDRLLRQAIRYGGGWTVTLAVVALFNAAAELLLPAVLGRAVDAALGGAGAWWPLVACGLVLVIVATDTVGDLASGVGTAHATARLRHRLLRHLLALDPRVAARHPVGDLIGRLVGQAGDAGQAGVSAVLVFTALLPPAGGVVALTLLDWRLGATFVAGLLLLAAGIRAFLTDASNAAAGYLRVQGQLAGRLSEALCGARTIAAAGTVHSEISRVLVPLPGLRDYGRRTWASLARASARTAAVAPMLQLAVVAVGGWSVAAGRLTPGQLFAALQYAALGAGLGAVVAMLNRLVRARAGAHRLAAVLAEPAQPSGTATLPPGAGRLVLSGVTVRADDGRRILDAVDLRVPPGAVLAVVGPSGAGKSTLAAVAGRLYDPDAGEVLLDGVPLRRLSRTALRRAVGYGFERPALVGDTVAEVIGLAGRPATTPDPTRPGTPQSDPPQSDPSQTSSPQTNSPQTDPPQTDPPQTDPPQTDPPRPDPAYAGTAVLDAARAAAIDGFVERLPDAYSTRIVDAPMSGGEAQRLGLARALSAERLLILDDATSSVDTATARRITQAIARHRDRRTRLIVTHRAATAAEADLVAWLDGGRLRAVGPHRELWHDADYRAVFQQPAPPPADPARSDPARPDVARSDRAQPEPGRPGAAQARGEQARAERTLAGHVDPRPAGPSSIDPGLAAVGATGVGATGVGEAGVGATGVGAVGRTRR